jgi:hypothetical protein
MKGFFGVVAGSVFLVTSSGVFAVPPKPGKHFDCSDSAGSPSSCATDDAGCVPGTKDDPSNANTVGTLKCGDGISRAFSKAIVAVVKCHQKQADAAFKVAPFEDDVCESANDGQSAKAKLDAAITKITPLCTSTQLATAAAEESLLFAPKTTSGSLDDLNGQIYCSGTVDIDPGGDDAGKVPPDKGNLSCEDTTARTLGKLAGAIVKCHIKMADRFFVGNEYDEEACEDGNTSRSAVEKFNAGMDKLDGKALCTDACNDRTARNALRDQVKGLVEAVNPVAYPCPATTTTTTIAVPTTTTTTNPCSCVGGFPHILKFTTGLSGGICGNLQNDGGTPFFDLACGGLYLGGGLVSWPQPSVIPDQTVSLINTTCNDPANPGLTSLTLTGTSSAQTGSNRNCTHAGCLFGPPFPIVNRSYSLDSTCVINTLSADAAGTSDCSSGTTVLGLHLSSTFYVTGDMLLPNRCSAGANAGRNCTSDADCPGGTCVDDQSRCENTGAVCRSDSDCGTSECSPGFCSGGTNAGKGCVASDDCPGGSCKTFIQPCPICNPSTHKCNGGPNDNLACTPADSPVDSDYPTSHDCPPPPSTVLGTLPFTFNLTTGTSTVTASDYSTQTNVFCGLCGNSVLGTFKNPAVSCTTDSQCAAISGFTQCRQKHPGAFTAADVARTITLIGSPAAGATVGGAPVASTLVANFCFLPTGATFVDNGYDIPGPGAATITGTAQLLP